MDKIIFQIKKAILNIPSFCPKNEFINELSK